MKYKTQNLIAIVFLRIEHLLLPLRLVIIPANVWTLTKASHMHRLKKGQAIRKTTKTAIIFAAMQMVKNIIFDLGGVFVGIDYSKTQQAFTKLEVQEFHTYYTQYHASDLFEALETGKLEAEEFYNHFRNHLNTTLRDEQIEEAWNALIGSFYPDRLAWLDGIRHKYKVFLLSNTNVIHHKALMKIYREQTGKDDFDDYFIKAYYSHQMGLRKPYAEAYEHVLNEQNIKASETLFIDDTLPNVEGAQKVGLQTIHLLPGMSLIDLGL